MAAREQAEALERLTRLLPDLTASVRSGLTVSSQIALAAPIDLARQIAELAAEEGTPLAPSFVEDVAATVRDHGVSDEFVRDETAHSKTELVRHWFGCLLKAWQLWGQSTGKLTLNRYLLPSESGVPKDTYATWRDFYDASKEGLFASIALGEKDLVAATEGFVHNVLAAVRVDAALELPNDLALKRRGEELLVVAR